jgi:Mg2+ and Co2+ transporter CorA
VVVPVSAQAEVAAMEVRLVTGGSVTRHAVDELETLLAKDDALVWVDIPACDATGSALLSRVFGFHPMAVRDCEQRNSVPKLHMYPDHVFVVLHAPEPGRSGHVHYVELDQFVGPNYFVTVHGPVNSAVASYAATLETETLARRLDSGRLHVSAPYDLSYGLVSALTKRMRDNLASLTELVWSLERQVTAGQLGDSEEFLDEMFRVRHGLLALRTMAMLSREVYGRMTTLEVFGGDRGQSLLTDLVDQFDRLTTMADGQKDYLQGVIEFYQTRTNTKMTIAAERLAVIAAVTLPVTALSSVLGMNVIVNSSTHYGALVVLLVVMSAMSAALLIWSKRKGWW